MLFLQLLINTIDAFRSPEAIASIEYAALDVQAALNAWSIPIALTLVAVSLTLWYLGRSTDTALVTGFSRLRKPVAKAVAVAAVVSSFTFLAERATLAQKAEDSRARIQARYTALRDAQQGDDRNTLALHAIARVVSAQHPEQKQFVRAACKTGTTRFARVVGNAKSLADAGLRFELESFDRTEHLVLGDQHAVELLVGLREGDFELGDRRRPTCSRACAMTKSRTGLLPVRRWPIATRLRLYFDPFRKEPSEKALNHSPRARPST